MDPTEEVLDQTLNRVLIVKAHTPEELNTWLNRLTQTVSHAMVCLQFNYRVGDSATQCGTNLDPSINS